MPLPATDHADQPPACKGNRKDFTLGERELSVGFRKQTKKFIYSLLIRYCSTMQAADVHITKKDIEKLEKVQKRAVKMIQRLKKAPHTEALKEFNLFKLSRRRLRSHLITLGNTFTRRNQRFTYTSLTKEPKKGTARTNCWRLQRQANENCKKIFFFTIIVQKILSKIGKYHIFESELNVLEIVSITDLGKAVLTRSIVNK